MLIVSKSEYIDSEAKRRAPKDANAYSYSPSREMQDSRDGFPVTEFSHCCVVAVQYYKLD